MNGQNQMKMKAGDDDSKTTPERRAFQAIIALQLICRKYLQLEEIISLLKTKQ